MKNKLFIIISIFLASIILAGCFTESNAAISTSKAMRTSLNQLSSSVKKLDTLDNSYIRETSNKNTTNTINSLPRKNTDPMATAIATDNSNINQLLEDAIISRLIYNNDGNCVICNEKYNCNENGTCDNCYSSINCDQYGNCVYCKNELELNGQNCNTCNNNVVLNTNNSNLNHITSKLKQNRTLSQNNIDTDQINTIENKENIINNIDNTNTPIDNNTDDDINIEPNANIPNIQFMFYSEDSFVPENLKYNPRYIRSYDVNTANEHMSNYITKIQKFYAISTDVLEANNTLSDYKVTVLTNIDETNDLNNNIISGVYTPNEQQIIALNNYISDIKNTIKNLKDCNGRLNNEINNIVSAKSLTTSIDVINSNYVKILNHIDTRISYHENALATLEQIKFLITDMSNNQNADSNIVNDTTMNNDSLAPDITNNETLIDNNASVINNENYNPDNNSLNNLIPENDNIVKNDKKLEDNNNGILNNNPIILDNTNYHNNNSNDHIIDTGINPVPNTISNTTQEILNYDSNYVNQKYQLDDVLVENQTPIIDSYDDRLFLANIDTFTNNNSLINNGVNNLDYNNTNTPSQNLARRDIVTDNRINDGLISTNENTYDNYYINNL